MSPYDYFKIVETIEVIIFLISFKKLLVFKRVPVELSKTLKFAYLLNKLLVESEGNFFFNYSNSIVIKVSGFSNVNVLMINASPIQTS